MYANFQQFPIKWSFGRNSPTIISPFLGLIQVLDFSFHCFYCEWAITKIEFSKHSEEKLIFKVFFVWKKTKIRSDFSWVGKKGIFYSKRLKWVKHLSIYFICRLRIWKCFWEINLEMGFFVEIGPMGIHFFSYFICWIFTENSRFHLTNQQCDKKFRYFSFDIYYEIRLNVPIKSFRLMKYLGYLCNCLSNFRWNFVKRKSFFTASKNIPGSQKQKKSI